MTLAEIEIVGKVFRNLATIKSKEEFVKLLADIKDKMDDLAHKYVKDDLPFDRDDYLAYHNCYSLLVELKDMYE